MSIETHRIAVGARGWQHQTWLVDFYPEDLPQDWQLGFYANEFPVVYMAAKDWVNKDTLDDWQDNVDEKFRFVLQIADEILTDERAYLSALSKAASLGEQCLALVISLTPSMCDNREMLLAMLEQAKKITPLTPLCIDKKEQFITPAVRAVLESCYISEVWDGHSDKNGLRRGKVAVVHLVVEEQDPKQLKYVLENCLQASSEERMVVLCIDGNPPRIEILNNAKIILDLL